MKLWSGRFSKNVDSTMDAFHSSISFDNRLFKYDIVGSIAHVKMLGKQKIIPIQDAELIEETLRKIEDELLTGQIELDANAEDIHMFVEAQLIMRIGDVGKRVHTARSRNDQVALDMRMYTKDVTKKTIEALCDLVEALIEIADKHVESIMPGYTHLQKAQPITLAHHLLAYCEMFSRDISRFRDSYVRTNIMPLGSGALATSTYPIDRSYVAKELGFPAITQNSMDAVSDRDFCIEFCSCAAISMMHLSRFCEEIILWSSDEFKFVEIDDAFSTGSSIMPQKKNPDACELIRGKSARVISDLNTLLIVMKSLPLAYNKDMQEDKEATFDASDTLLACLDVFTRMIKTTFFNINVMSESAKKGFTNATDAADYLVKKGLPFRDAHEIIGKLVAHCLINDKSLNDISLDEYKEFSELFENDIYSAIAINKCVENRNVAGGPSPKATKARIANMRAWLNNEKHKKML